MEDKSKSVNAPEGVIDQPKHYSGGNSNMDFNQCVNHIKLNGRNYLPWAQSMRIFIWSRRRLGFINGSKPPQARLIPCMRNGKNHRSFDAPLCYFASKVHLPFVRTEGISTSGFSTRAASELVKFCIMVSSTETMEVSKFTKLNSARKSTPCSTNVRATPDIEKKFVHRVYDAIAPHFSATRFAKWPKVASFLNSLSPGSIVLDAGCGNGKYLGFNPNCFYIGCDISPPLIGICAGKGHEVLVADAVNLPYKTNFGDAAISIAVLHHLSTESRRRNAIEELIRVVRKGGLVLITVWAVEQEDSSLLSKWTPLSDKYNEAWVRPSSPRLHNSVALVLEQIPETNEDCSATEISKDQSVPPEEGEEDRRNDDTSAASIFNGAQEDAVSSGSGEVETNQEYFVPWHLPYHRAEVGGTLATEIANGLAKKDDKKGAVVYNRYYHVFVEGELQRLVAGIDNVKTVEQFYDKSNWCVLLQKT